MVVLGLAAAVIGGLYRWRLTPADPDKWGLVDVCIAMRIGVDLGGTKIEVIALDDLGATLFRQRVATPKGDYERTLESIVNLIRTAEQQLHQTGTVGLASPGAISNRTGRLKNSNSTTLNGRPLDRDLSEKLGRPIRLENDANCFALSEAWPRSRVPRAQRAPSDGRGGCPRCRHRRCVRARLPDGLQGSPGPQPGSRRGSA